VTFFVERLIPQAYVLAVILVPIASAVVLRRRVSGGRISKGRACGLFAALALSPVAFYLGFFFALVGLEELTKQALISEGLGRGVVLVVAAGVLVAAFSMVAFAMSLMFIRRDRANPE